VDKIDDGAIGKVVAAFSMALKSQQNVKSSADTRASVSMPGYLHAILTFCFIIPKCLCGSIE